jgi:hypothetical protein
MKPADYPGLEFWVQPGGSKSWQYQYRIKGVKAPIRKKIGLYSVIGVVEANARAKKISKDIYECVDPRQTQKIEILNLQLGKAIRTYCAEELTLINQYRPATIKGVKAIFGPFLKILEKRCFRKVINKNTYWLKSYIFIYHYQTIYCQKDRYYLLYDLHVHL